jgi:hypothetical protein
MMGASSWLRGVPGRGSVDCMANSVRPQPLLAVRDVRASARWSRLRWVRRAAPS